MKNKANVLLILSAIVIIITFFVIYKAYSDGSQLATTTDLQKENRSKENQTLEWKQLRCGLWINKQGEIGFRDSKANENQEVTFVFITQTPIGGDIPLKKLIDTTTFHHLESSFYKDKKHIYHHYAMADGGSFSPVNVDYATFKIIGDGCFAKDKNHIYSERNLIALNADLASFHIIKYCLAKDKKNYFLYDEKVSEKEAKEYLEDLE